MLFLLKFFSTIICCCLLCFFFWHVLRCWFPRITHSKTFGEGMWLCGIMACLLPINRVKQRTTSLLLHDHNPLGLYHHLLPNPQPNPPTGSQQTATSEEVLLVPCRRTAKQAILGPNTPSSARLSLSSPLCLSIYSSVPPSQLSPCLFFIERKPETCRVCFPPPLGQVPAFTAQVLANRESSFRKTWGRSFGHGGWGGVGEGGLHGWMLMSLWSLDVFIVQTGWSVCQLPVKQSKTHSSLLTYFEPRVTASCCVPHYSHSCKCF